MTRDHRADVLGAATHSSDAGPSWHALSVDRVEATLGTGAGGVTEEEAARRLANVGPNALEEQPPTSPFVLLLHQFTSPLIYILLVATVVTLLLGEYIDAAVIGAVLLLNAAIGFTQERKAEQAVRALMQLLSPHARVIRQGREREIESRDAGARAIVVLLESGARVPADLRLAGATGLQIDESLLTGESLPVTKSAHSQPAESDASGGPHEHGVHGLRGDERARARLRRRDWSAHVAGRDRGACPRQGDAGDAAAAAHGALRADRSASPSAVPRCWRSASASALGESAADMFMVAVALAVAAVPEGLPVVFTITLAIGVEPDGEAPVRSSGGCPPSRRWAARR